ERGLAPATGSDETGPEADPAEHARSTLLDRLGARLAQLAHGVGIRSTRHRRALASRLASPPVDSAVELSSRGPSANRSARPHARSRDGCGESIVGSAADSWRIADTRRRRLRTHGIASAEAVPASTLANLEDVPDKSPHGCRGYGFLHRAHAHRSRLVCAGRV